MKFLAFIYNLDSTAPKEKKTQLEPRRQRRQRERDAAKSHRVTPMEPIQTAIDANLSACKLGTPSNADNKNPLILKPEIGDFMYAPMRMIQTSP